MPPLNLMITGQLTPLIHSYFIQGQNLITWKFLCWGGGMDSSASPMKCGVNYVFESQNKNSIELVEKCSDLKVVYIWPES